MANTLLQEIDSLDADQVFFVGAESGYFFIGTKADMWCDCYLIDKQLHEGFSRRWTVYHTRDHNGEPMIDMRGTNTKEKKEEALKNFELLYGKMMRKSWHFWSKEVVEKYNRSFGDKEPCFLLDIPGGMGGGFWFRQEYVEWSETERARRKRR